MNRSSPIPVYPVNTLIPTAIPASKHSARNARSRGGCSAPETHTLAAFFLAATLPKEAPVPPMPQKFFFSFLLSLSLYLQLATAK